MAVLLIGGCSILGGIGVSFAPQFIGFNILRHPIVLSIQVNCLTYPSIGSLTLLGLLIILNPTKAITLNTKPIRNINNKFSQRGSGNLYLDSKILHIYPFPQSIGYLN